MQHNNGEKTQFLQQLALLLEEHAPDIAESGNGSRALHVWPEAGIGLDSARQLGGFLDRFPEVGNIQIDLPRAAMRIR